MSKRLGKVSCLKSSSFHWFRRLSQSSMIRCGGSRVGSHLKMKRPLKANLAIHLVLRSAVAKGPNSLLRWKHREKIDNLIVRQARRFHIKIYRFANVGNHLHILMRISSRDEFNAYIRSVTGLIPRIVLKKERGLAKTLESKDVPGNPNEPPFWEGRPFTRLVQWGPDYVGVKNYVEKNIMQSQSGNAVSALWLETCQYMSGTG